MPQRLVGLKALDQGARRRNVEHRLGDEGAGQGRPILDRPTGQAMEMGKEALDPRKLKHGDEAPVPLAERPELLLKPREKIRLNAMPESG